VACELELWQEAFRSVEDIQGLAALGRKAPKPQLMATYYAQLTRIFTVSGAHLYNGCAAPAETLRKTLLRKRKRGE
jgi:translation initiation factor 3 subunit A